MNPSRLTPAPLALDAALPGVDPAWVWACATAWRDFRRPGEPLPAHVAIAAERAAGGSFVALKTLGVSVPAAHVAAQARHFAATAPVDALPRLLAVGGPLARFELALPVIPQRPRPRPPGAGASPGTLRDRARGPLLLGVIDHGCPFAHELLRDAAGTGTRVLRIWDQDERAPAFAGAGGVLPAAMGYGAEIGRGALNALMQAAAAPGRAGAVDEDRCYRLAGCAALLDRGFGHGAAVITLLAGSRQPGRAMQQADPAATADLVFVQVPRDAVQDASSASLPRYVIDGLRWIASCAQDGQHVIVNLSDGTSRTLHDGSSLVEQAVAELALELTDRAITLEVVVAAGNSGDEERHALFDPAAADSALRRAVLRVPPDNETPTFVTLRVPAAGQRLRVTAPDGAVATVGPGEAWGWTRPGAAAPCAGLVVAAPAPGRPAAGLLVIGATRSEPGAATAPAGDWRVELLPGDPSAAPVQAWVSRCQRNAGALPRSRQARFVDVDGGYDPHPHRRCLEVDPDPPRSAIRRAGSLNGIACLPPDEGLVVAASALLRERRASRYASSGPAAAAARPGPDWAAAADFSTNQLGRPAAGTRSGVATRATGSSFAAPRVARELARRAFAPPPTEAAARPDGSRPPGPDDPAPPPPSPRPPPRPDPARLGVGILAD